MSALSELRQALDRAADQGERRAFWWRDDDAQRPGPKLAGLLAKASSVGAAVGVAAIPAGSVPELFDACAEAGAAVLQHGVAHQNHQSEGKHAELGDARPVDEVLAACVAARERLAGAATFIPVMVPPWNRMAPELTGHLAGSSYWGVSLFAGPPQASPLSRIDTHIDPIAWRSGRDLADDAALGAMVQNALSQPGPVGLLTHHIDHTARIERWVAEFADLVAHHPAAAWVTPRALFEPAVAV